VRVVPSRLRAGTFEQWLAAHREAHTPRVRRQPGFIAKLLLQAEDDPQQVAMLLVWESSEQALAWTAHPEHDTAGEPLRPLVLREGGPQTALPRGGYRAVDIVAR
jgi:heme-degrading monooxygenase HmoA